MKRAISILGALIVFYMLSSPPATAWGFMAHKKINYMAVFTLPSDMIGFYKRNIDYITRHAVDADKRRHKVEQEAARHYIDADHYGLHPFDSIPRQWKKAVAKYSEDTLKAYGILPWYIDLMKHRLTEAFRKGDVKEILYLSANVGHYIADAHVPLHTTENYNGQLTNQKGIHGLWETRIPELKAEGYNYFTGKAVYIEKPINAAWEAVITSFSEKDTVLKLEAQLSATFEKDRKYSLSTKGRKTTHSYSQEYVEAYDGLLNHMVERRMRTSIHLVGSIWYTAWVDAGQPDLDKLSREVSLPAETDSLSDNAVPIKGHED